VATGQALFPPEALVAGEPQRLPGPFITLKTNP